MQWYLCKVGWLVHAQCISASVCTPEDRDTGDAKGEAKNNGIVALSFGSLTVSGAGYEAGD